MIKTVKNSYFKLVKGCDLEGNKNIIQIDTEKQYKNKSYGVYLCEVCDDKEPEEMLTPCERDGHNFKDFFSNGVYGYAYCYCTKCGEKKKIQI